MGGCEGGVNEKGGNLTQETFVNSQFKSGKFSKVYYPECR